VSSGQKLIIDGYNVIFTGEGLRRMAIKDRRSARDRLVEMLGDYLHNKRIQATVVFDGRGGIVDAESVLPGKLQVLYSTDRQTADDLIIVTIKGSGNPRSFIVVSSDGAVRTEARALGCEVIGSKNFLERLTQERDSADKEPTSPIEDFGDTNYWLERFGQDPDD